MAKNHSSIHKDYRLELLRMAQEEGYEELGKWTAKLLLIDDGRESEAPSLSPVADVILRLNNETTERISEAAKKGGAPKGNQNAVKNQPQQPNQPQQLNQPQQPVTTTISIPISNIKKHCPTESDVEDKKTDKDKPIYSKDFEIIWATYPNKAGKSVAYEYYQKWLDGKKKVGGRKVVLNNREMFDAVKNYIEFLDREENGWRKPQDGSTFFNKTIYDYAANGDGEVDDDE
jgi:hypothetical protein